MLIVKNPVFLGVSHDSASRHTLSIKEEYALCICKCLIRSILNEPHLLPTPLTFLLLPSYDLYSGFDGTLHLTQQTVKHYN